MCEDAGNKSPGTKRLSGEIHGGETEQRYQILVDRYGNVENDAGNDDVSDYSQIGGPVSSISHSHSMLRGDVNYNSDAVGLMQGTTKVTELANITIDSPAPPQYHVKQSRTTHT